MHRRSIIRLLLSLVLLLSQQMAMAHAVSHWTGPDGKLTVAAEQDCLQCLALEQLDVPLLSHAAPWAPSGAAVTALPSLDLFFIGRTTCVFLSRAPPQA
jgi:hypothetical protein